jgi:hypothetical protein
LAMVLLGVATAIVPAVTRPCPAPQLEQKDGNRQRRRMPRLVSVGRDVARHCKNL